LKMDSQRHKVLVVLIFTMVIHYIMLQVMAIQYVSLSYHHFILDAVDLIALKKLVSKPKN
jgi:hypothetical protein